MKNTIHLRKRERERERERERDRQTDRQSDNLSSLQVLRLQVDVQQVRSDIEKRIQEKEEEFENTRKTHQRQIDSLQVTHSRVNEHVRNTKFVGLAGDGGQVEVRTSACEEDARVGHQPARDCAGPLEQGGQSRQRTNKRND